MNYSLSVITENEDFGTIHIESPKFGVFDFIIDLDDVEKCKPFTWCIARGGRGDFKEYYYAMSTRTHGHNGILLQRFLTNAPKGMTADHENGDTTDNRKENLRICTFQENCRNRKMSRRNSSGYLGVTWVEKEHKWMAYIHLDMCKKFKNLGYYTDLEEAHQARVSAEKKYFGDFLRVERDTNANKIHYPDAVNT